MNNPFFYIISCVIQKKIVPLSRNMQFRRFGEQKYAKKHIIDPRTRKKEPRQISND